MSDTTICKFIRHAEADYYRAEGWDVTEMIGYSAYWSMLATREEPAPARRWVGRREEGYGVGPSGAAPSPPRRLSPLNFIRSLFSKWRTA